MNSQTSLLHNYGRANLCTIVQVDYVIVGQANAARRYAATKLPGLVRSMNAV
jgi:hypothetical protein